jgi:hypothetical protein
MLISENQKNKGIYSFSMKRLTISLIILTAFTTLLAGEQPDAGKVFNPGGSTGQRPDFKRWFYGFNSGAYFAHPSTANYYNGTGDHNVEKALNLIYNRDRLIRGVNEIIQDFSIGELPESMQYSPGIQVGFFGGLSLNRSLAVMAEFNYARIRVADKFTLYTDKFTSTSEPYILVSDIYGREERIDLRIGFNYTFFTRKTFHPFIGSGINITDVKVLENKVGISGMEFSIRDITEDYYGVRDYGMGLGQYSEAGLQFEVNESFSLKMGASISFSRINIGDNKNIAPQYTLFVRINLDEIFANP